MVIFKSDSQRPSPSNIAPRDDERKHGRQNDLLGNIAEIAVIKGKPTGSRGQDRDERVLKGST